MGFPSGPPSGRGRDALVDQNFRLWEAKQRVSSLPQAQQSTGTSPQPASAKDDGSREDSDGQLPEDQEEPPVDGDGKEK